MRFEVTSVPQGVAEGEAQLGIAVARAWRNPARACRPYGSGLSFPPFVKVDGSRGASRLWILYMRRGAPRDAGTSDGQVLGLAPVASPEGWPSRFALRPRAHGGRLPRTRLSRTPTFVAHSVRARGMGDPSKGGGGGDKSCASSRSRASLTLFQGEGVGPQGRRVGVRKHRRALPPTRRCAPPSPPRGREGPTECDGSCPRALSWICQGGLADANAAQILPPPHAGEVVRWVGRCC